MTEKTNPKLQAAIAEMADEAERLNAEPNDEQGIVRAIVTRALPDRPTVHFEAWFLVCCELADRSAQREGFKNQSDRAAARAFGRTSR